MAAQKRLEQLNAEIQKNLSQIIRSLKDPRINGIISIQEVNLTRDFSYCTIYVSIFNSTDKDLCFKQIVNSGPYIRRELAKTLDIRIVPELQFRLDTTLEYAEKIEKIIKETKKV